MRIVIDAAGRVRTFGTDLGGEIKVLARNDDYLAIHVGRGTHWADLMVGHVYHSPKIIVYRRKDGDLWDEIISWKITRGRK